MVLRPRPWRIFSALASVATAGTPGKRRRRWIIVIGLGLAFVLPLVIADQIVSHAARDRLFDDVHLVPHKKVGLLLGTAKYLGEGQTNLYYDYRIDAALELWRAGKVDYLLVSGDNRSHRYNEPREMRKSLLARGVPASRIFTDFAGLRTLDSVVRCKQVFGQSEFTVISQRFHNERALYLAAAHGLDVVGYNARDVALQSGFKTRIREVLARLKVFIDLLLHTAPRHLGPPIDVGHAELGAEKGEFEAVP